MKKGSGTKTRISITLDKGLAKELDSLCKKRLMKVSNYVERLIQTGLKNEK
ncbi:MAG: ribbon-helix-helix domain-containing protein [Nanoarchaeota archaeon]|nr:ribbon-helix-helix domain-containing protein [Nanoarchaeota archaeon]